MRTRITLFFGIFAVMALSNAIVPVLPSYAEGSVLQGAIYSAYFLGAFISTLPAGVLSDRYGRVPVIQSGLAVTVASGLLLSVFTLPFPVLAARCLEGVGAGFFLAAALSYVNSVPNHERMSGYFMALLNAGLVIGLVLSGWLGVHIPVKTAAIVLFAGLALLPAVTSLFMPEPPVSVSKKNHTVLIPLIREYRWLWYSSVILVGVTGVVISLYPKFSGASADFVGIWIAIMSIATIGAVLVASRFSLPPIPAIRWCAVLMVIGVMISFYSPLGFVMIGALAGVVMIAQMAFLAVVKDHQGVAMGLFTTTSYLGMTALPLIAGLIADSTSFFYAFLVTAFFSGTVALSIGWCACRERPVS